MLNAKKKSVYTLDLNFMGIDGAIASYLIPHSNGAILVECGPGSTIPALEAELHKFGYAVGDITDVLLTHIHLDHAGAAGWFAQKGANIYVHPVGAPHLLDPGKLLSSAARIYGDMMETLWGEFLPVPPERIQIPEDNEVIEINDLQFRTLDTPGHANHHYAYVYENVCFSGDIGGVRISGTHHLRLPMPPPELILEKWGESYARLKHEFSLGRFTRIAPTHFGIYPDPAWHLEALSAALDAVKQWLETVMPADPSIDSLNRQYSEWSHQRALNDGLPDETIDAYETANPTWMSAYGLQRYWRKYRMQD